MTAIRRIIRAIASRRDRRAGASVRASRRRAGIALEHLDQRQLMSVDFTGNVIADFPEATNPGVVVLRPDPGDPNFRTPIIPSEPPGLREFIRVSGLELDAVRVSYDQQRDILSLGLEQPLNQKTGQRVIAGDTDNNLDGGTVAPEVQALPVFFEDPGLLGGTETMYATIDFLNNDNLNDPATLTDNVVAGITNGVDPATMELLPKGYQVAEFSAEPLRSGFGAPLPQFTGSSFLANAPEAGGFEFEIRAFSTLYQQRTGQVLTVDSPLSIGAVANSGQDDGISEALLPGQPFRFGDSVVPLPPPPVVCPPVTPTVVINPHEGRHVNTAHNGIVRAYILGSDTFDVRQIVPESVQLAGASPTRPPFFSRVNGDTRLDVTYFFQADQINLPPGIVDAPITGVLTDGTEFRGTAQIFNRASSFYNPLAVAAQQARAATRAALGSLTGLPERIAARFRALGAPEAAMPAVSATPPIGPTLADLNRPGLSAALQGRQTTSVGPATRLVSRPSSNPAMAADASAWDEALSSLRSSSRRSASTDGPRLHLQGTLAPPTSIGVDMGVDPHAGPSR